MEAGQREITLHTPGKVYTGAIDMANSSVRTTDFFNSASLYWKNPAEKSFDDALLLHQARIILEGDTKLSEFGKLQLRLADVVFFFDELKQSGDEKEKLRAATLKARTKEETSLLQAITHTHNNSFFFITGVFYGLFKSKSNLRFMPLTEATVTKVIWQDGRWQKQKIAIGHDFVGISIRHIESCTFAERR
jgi:hypothetical protein